MQLIVRKFDFTIEVGIDAIFLKIRVTVYGHSSEAEYQVEDSPLQVAENGSPPLTAERLAVFTSLPFMV